MKSGKFVLPECIQTSHIWFIYTLFLLSGAARTGLVWYFKRFHHKIDPLGQTDSYHFFCACWLRSIEKWNGAVRAELMSSNEEIH